MTIKSLLLGSAAALAVVSGAQAADAIVAAEPEAVEYVRVCDAYGTGYFYIPGTETCLKIEGYVRFDVNFGFGDAYDNNGGEDWYGKTRGQVQFTAKSDTEYGPLTGVIVYQANYTGGGDSYSNSTVLDTAYIDIAGFRVGKFVNWWDDDLSGEFDQTNSGVTSFNTIRYQYESGDFYAGIALEELGGTDGDLSQSVALQDGNNNLGIDAGLGGTAGAFTYQLIAGYDLDAQAGAVRGKIGVDIGPGNFALAAIWASDPSHYFVDGQWAIAAQYAIKATDKFTITPGVQYTGDSEITGSGTDADFDGGHIWRAGVTFDYQIVDNLSTKLAVTYVNHEFEDGSSEDGVSGFFRLQRAF
jgi:hypothetical protein